MKKHELVRLAAVLVSVLAAPAATIRLASVTPAAASEAAVDPHPFEWQFPAATKAWCDSLPYPYCDSPAPGTPGVGRMELTYPMDHRPIFGR
jgi:hypothetical protein